MWNVKALLSMSLIAGGTSVAGVAMHIQNDPAAFTGPRPIQEPTRRGVTQVEAALSVLPESEPRVVNMQPVEIVLHRPRPAPAVTERPVESRRPCGGWQKLAAGPEQRRVRVLCADLTHSN